MSPPVQQKSAAAVDRLREELACLQCGYSLRGLEGDVVRCPECGLEHDVTQIVLREWTGPWFTAPGFNRLVAPVVWLSVTGMFWSVVALIEVVSVESTRPIVSAATALGIALVWLWMLRKAAASLSIANGVHLALLGHAIFAGYVAGLFLVLNGVYWAISSLFGLLWVRTLVGVIALAVGCFLFWIGRRGEKYMASVCIRQYLLGGPAHGSP